MSAVFFHREAPAAQAADPLWRDIVIEQLMNVSFVHGIRRQNRPWLLKILLRASLPPATLSFRARKAPNGVLHAQLVRRLSHLIPARHAAGIGDQPW